MHRFLFVAIIVALVISSAVAGTNRVPLATVLEHNLSLTIHPSTKQALISDSGLITCARGWSLLYLADRAEVSRFWLNGKAISTHMVASSDTAGLSDELRKLISGVEIEPSVSLLFFKSKTAGTFPFIITYSATFDDPVENVQFSREKVGNEVRGTILEQGAYLSSAACFYPRGREEMARFSLTSSIPAHWTAIADGNPGEVESKGSQKIQKFANPYLSDGYVFMAAPYFIKSTKVEDIVVATYFFPEDSSLCDKYLTATADYIKMYQELIGPYPFTQFTVAENFFPTGYGMPGWTLLGQSVLKLPFIISSSLGHEVLHNWWGNSVYVDYERGNWCEAAAVYGADYRYKLMASEADAKGYRKDILKEYLSYVNSGNDFPLREFKSRSSAETRTIGYNKGMMLFHLIEQQIGTTAFFDAWRQIYRDYIGKAISWEEWIQAFQKSSGEDLSFIVPEWIDRAGAPEIGLEILSDKPTASGDKKSLTLELTQSGATPYHLSIPVVAEGAGTRESTVVLLSGESATAEFEVSSGATIVTVDPEFHLFRKLYPSEVEPIVSSVLGVEKKGFVSCSSESGSGEAFAAFASAVAEDTVTVVTSDQISGLPTDRALVLFDPVTMPDYLAGFVTLSKDSIMIDGKNYPMAGHTFVMAGQNWQGFEKYLVVLSGDDPSLPRVGQLVPHYGKYSYLVFQGAKNIAKGQWPVTESPLRQFLK